MIRPSKWSDLKPVLQVLDQRALLAVVKDLFNA